MPIEPNPQTETNYWLSILGPPPRKVRLSKVGVNALAKIVLTSCVVLGLLGYFIGSEIYRDWTYYTQGCITEATIVRVERHRHRKSSWRYSVWVTYSDEQKALRTIELDDVPNDEPEAASKYIGGRTVSITYLPGRQAEVSGRVWNESTFRDQFVLHALTFLQLGLPIAAISVSLGVSAIFRPYSLLKRGDIGLGEVTSVAHPRRGNDVDFTNRANHKITYSFVVPFSKVSFQDAATVKYAMNIGELVPVLYMKDNPATHCLYFGIKNVKLRTDSTES